MFSADFEMFRETRCKLIAVIARCGIRLREARPERKPREQCAMTASPKGKAKSLKFEVRSRGAEAAAKKFNVFAEWQEVCHLSFGQEIFLGEHRRCFEVW
jgi:hypothetical protein